MDRRQATERLRRAPRGLTARISGELRTLPRQFWLLGGWALDALGSRSAFVAIAAAGLLGAAFFALLRGGEPAGGVEAEGPVASAALAGELRGERPEQAL
jgi:hypothetical protein